MAQQSARCISAYVYASAGVDESTTDLVFGGHAMIAANGVIVAENERFHRHDSLSYADVDIEKLLAVRRTESSFSDIAPQIYDDFNIIMLDGSNLLDELLYTQLEPQPFVPSGTEQRSRRCQEIFNIQIPFFKTLKPFIVKEFLSHLRNKNYIRLKIISLVIYLTILIVIDIFYQDYFASAISFLTILLIWEHYSHQFNEKYVMKESRFFIRVLPVRYYQYGLSKFFTEFFYITLILIIVFILSLIHQIELIKILNILGIVMLFSIFVLYIITIIRIIFYDNPRMAGYAYHFLIIFTLVMIYNFYLVGPVITLFIILYLQLISYRQFTR